MRAAWATPIILAGIVVAAFNLRPGVTGLSPLLDLIGDDIALSGGFLAIIGMLPPLLFGLGGFIAPRLITRYSALTMTLVAMSLIVAGLGVRGLVSSPSVFLLSSVVALAGMGLGNVVVPPIVKSYFPDRVALLSTVHVGFLQLGTFLPPLVAVPLADRMGWRGSLCVWVGTAVAALALWAVIAALRPQARAAVSASVVGGRELRRLLSTPRAWALMTMTGLTSLNNFILFTWLPTLLTRAGFTSAFAGAMLALVTAVPLVLGFALPAIAARMPTAAPIVAAFCLCLGVGYLGLWLDPQLAPVLWTVLLGIGISTFPLALTLITLRSRTPAASAALSGFVQGGGYLLAATGPLAFALLIEAFDTPAPAFALVLASVVLKLIVAIPACRPGYI